MEKSKYKSDKKIALIVPCYNEEYTIEKVLKDALAYKDSVSIYVYDNNSTDRTAEIASKFDDVILIKCPLQGKGNVVRQAFEEIDAEAYVLIDGDDTYPMNRILDLCNPVLDGSADMVVGDRLSSTYFTENKRPFHNFGNIWVRFLVNVECHSSVKDIMTGYRALSRNLVRMLNLQSEGFEIETEMTIAALKGGAKVVDIPIEYKDRPVESPSKLNTIKDGIKVTLTALKMINNNRCINDIAAIE